MNRNIAAFTCVMESQPEEVSADGVGICCSHGGERGYVSDM